MKSTLRILPFLMILTFFLTFPTRALPQQDPQSYIDNLVHQLFDPSAAKRAAAAKLLGDFRVTQATKPLIIVHAYDEVPLVRQRAGEALGKIGGTEPIPHLMLSLCDREGYVLRISTRALGILRNTKSVDTLGGVLTNELEFTRKQKLLIMVRNLIRRILWKRSPATCNPQGIVSDFHTTEKCSAATALGRIGSSEALPFLITALSDPEWEVRTSSATALGMIKDESALEALQSLLNDPNGIVVEAAKWAIDRITGNSDGEALVSSSGANPGESMILDKSSSSNPEITEDDFLLDFLRKNGLMIFINSK